MLIKVHDLSCFQYCVQFTINMDVVFMNSKCGACSKHLMVSCKILNLPEILIMSFDHVSKSRRKCKCSVGLDRYQVYLFYSIR